MVERLVDFEEKAALKLWETFGDADAGGLTANTLGSALALVLANPTYVPLLAPWEYERDALYET